MARRIESAYGLTNVRVVPNWIKVDDWRRDDAIRSAGRSRWNLTNDEFAFLVLGRLQHTKGYMDAVNAFRLAFPSESKLRLIVAGGGPPSLVERLRADTALDPRILVAGEIPAGELALTYQAADAFVMPSRIL